MSHCHSFNIKLINRSIPAVTRTSPTNPEAAKKPAPESNPDNRQQYAGRSQANRACEHRPAALCSRSADAVYCKFVILLKMKRRIHSEPVLRLYMMVENFCLF
jgi:hypothetical protein